MIELSNGHKFMWQCGSGALGFDGNGWWWEHPLRWLGIIDPTELTVVAKTITSIPLKGNLSMWHPWTCVRPLGDGNMLNAAGLTNPGVLKWVSKYYPRAKAKRYKIAASIMSDSWEDAFVLGAILKDCDLAFIEVNVSCPNVGKKSPADMISKVVSGLKMGAPRHPLIIKLSFQQTQDEELLASIADNPLIEAVHVMNSIPWDVIYPDVESPLSKLGGGGVSGPTIHSLTWNSVINVSRACPNKPIVAGGGIVSTQEVINYAAAGATAYSFGTVYLTKPWMPKKIMSIFRDYPMDLEQLCCS